MKATTTLFWAAIVGVVGACTSDVTLKQGASGELCSADEDCRKGLFCEARACTETNSSGDADPPDGPFNNSDSNPPPSRPPADSKCDTDDDCPRGTACVADTESGSRRCLEACRDDDDCLPDEGCDAGRCQRLDDNNDEPPEVDPPPPLPVDCEDLCARVEDCDIATYELCIDVCESTIVDYPADVGVIILECFLDIDECDELSQSIGRCLDGTAERARVCDDLAAFAEEICRDPDLYEETRGACLDEITRSEESFMAINRCLEVDDCQAHTECVAAWSQR